MAIVDGRSTRIGDAIRTEFEGGVSGPQPENLTASFETLVDLQQQGLIRHLGVSNVTAEQVAQAQSIAPIVSVQNAYNLAYRSDDDLVDRLVNERIAYVPFFPLGGGFTPYISDGLSAVAARRNASPKAVALSWLLHRSPNIVVIAGTSSTEHLLDNITGAGLTLTDDDLVELNGTHSK